MLRHEKTCKLGVKFKYKGGVYHPKRNIFQLIEDLGITAENELKFYPFQAVFDYEVFSKETGMQKHGSTEFVSQHIPLSFCVLTNVLGFTAPYFEVSQGDSHVLVNKILDHLVCRMGKSIWIAETEIWTSDESIKSVCVQTSRVGRSETRWPPLVQICYKACRSHKISSDNWIQQRKLRHQPDSFAFGQITDAKRWKNHCHQAWKQISLFVHLKFELSGHLFLITTGRFSGSICTNVWLQATKVFLFLWLDAQPREIERNSTSTSSSILQRFELQGNQRRRISTMPSSE